MKAVLALTAVLVCPASVMGQSAPQGTSTLQTSAQTPAIEFEVVSIKRNVSGEPGNSMRTLPDGTRVMLNTTVQSFIRSASPVPPDAVEGLPEWATTERYDVIAKPPAGSPREQQGDMMRTMLRDRFKVVGHVEQRERDVFDLVLAREDGRLGPNISLSNVDCRPGGPPPANPTFEGVRGTCATMFGQGRIASGGTSLNGLLGSLGGLVGRPNHQSHGAHRYLRAGTVVLSSDTVHRPAPSGCTA
jgi:uncharacterized protein (TIGR03435 family)